MTQGKRKVTFYADDCTARKLDDLLLNAWAETGTQYGSVSTTISNAISYYHGATMPTLSTTGISWHDSEIYVFSSGDGEKEMRGNEQNDGNKRGSESS